MNRTSDETGMLDRRNSGNNFDATFRSLLFYDGGDIMDQVQNMEWAGFSDNFAGLQFSHIKNFIYKF